MGKKQKVNSREVGLLIGLIFNRYILKSEHLHFGYWSDGLEVDLLNLPRAQENYSDFVASQLPEGKRTILDVGCGVGAFAKKLINMGYEVDCVSPSAMLADRAQELLGKGQSIFRCLYEELQTENQYDLILFSESFQYVKIREAIEKSLSLLNDNGHLLICDYFRTEVKGKSLHRGGHKFSKFKKIISQYPLAQVSDVDITRETAPSVSIINDFFTKAVRPTRDLGFYFLDQNHPLLSRIVKWSFRKKLATIDTKYLSGQRDEKHFATYKTYRCLVYQKTNGSSSY